MRCTFSLWKSCHLRDGWPRSCSGFDLLALVPNFGLFSCRESTRSCLDGPMFLTQVSLRRPGTTVRLSCCDLGGVQTETTSLLASSSKSAYIWPSPRAPVCPFSLCGCKNRGGESEFMGSLQKNKKPGSQFIRTGLRESGNQTGPIHASRHSHSFTWAHFSFETGSW